jgi:1-phosphatidylinositol-4-phosphate 5-kinase
MFNPAFKEFRFKDFSPYLFARVREMCNITPSAYAQSFEATCKETFSEGRSGAFLFFSSDQRCIAKSTSKSELQSLLNLMPQYVDYLTRNPNSLISRFLGAHCITMYGVELYFIVMLNCFPPSRLSERYDLKGSWVNRHGLTRTTAAATAHSRRGRNGSRPARGQTAMLYLDNDLQQKLSFQPGVGALLAEQISKDVAFLACKFGLFLLSKCYLVYNYCVIILLS